MKQLIMKLIVLTLMVFTINVSAASRDNTSDKTKVIIQNKTFYAGMEITFNYGTDNERVAFIGNLDVSYNKAKDTLKIVLPRSEINNAIKSTDKTMYFLANIVIDYHDYKANEFLIRTNDDGTIYWLDNAGSLKQKYIPFLSTAIGLENLDDGAVTKIMGYSILYEGSMFNNITDEAYKDYTENDFTGSKQLVKTMPIIEFSIDEDEKIDLQNIENINFLEENDEGNTELKSEVTTDYEEEAEENNINNNPNNKEKLNTLAIIFIALGTCVIIAISIITYLVLTKKINIPFKVNKK